MIDVTPGEGAGLERRGFEDHLENVKEEVRPLARALYHLDIEHRRIRAGFANALGLSSSEFTALMFISDFGESTPKQLAQQLAITTGSATAMIDRLETAGLLSRTPNPHDRRSLLLNLTDHGCTAKKMVFGNYLAALNSIAEADDLMLTPAMIQSLERIASALGDSVESITVKGQ